jgi:hypothetical protein
VQVAFRTTLMRVTDHLQRMQLGTNLAIYIHYERKMHIYAYRDVMLQYDYVARRSGVQLFAVLSVC